MNKGCHLNCSQEDKSDALCSAVNPEGLCMWLWMAQTWHHGSLCPPQTFAMYCTSNIHTQNSFSKIVSATPNFPLKCIKLALTHGIQWPSKQCLEPWSVSRDRAVAIKRDVNNIEMNNLSKVWWVKMNGIYIFYMWMNGTLHIAISTTHWSDRKGDKISQVAQTHN